MKNSPSKWEGKDIFNLTGEELEEFMEDLRREGATFSEEQQDKKQLENEPVWSFKEKVISATGLYVIIVLFLDHPGIMLWLSALGLCFQTAIMPKFFSNLFRFVGGAVWCIIFLCIATFILLSPLGLLFAMYVIFTNRGPGLVGTYIKTSWKG